MEKKIKLLYRITLVLIFNSKHFLNIHTMDDYEARKESGNEDGNK